MRAVVVGSLNMDLVLRVPQLPVRGQTVLSRSLDRVPGGKGANQAVALSRLGAAVAMVGAVGADADGAALLAALAGAGVDTGFVAERADAPTGLAVVTVDADGDNAIGRPRRQRHPDPGRRGRSRGRPGRRRPAAAPARGPDRDGSAASAAPWSSSMPPRPARCPQSCSPWPRCWSSTKGRRPPSAATVDPAAAAARLRGRGPGTRVVTRGADGCLVAGPDGVATVAARAVPMVDTTAAGDCFAATLGLGLAEERPPVAAAALAAAATGLAVTRPGAQALPSRAEVEALLGGGAL